jgi:hypothetical protein
MSDSMHFDENDLRLLARSRLQRGELPDQVQQYMWAGAGDGQSCSLCDRPIGSQQIEYELQFNTQPVTVCRFHRICHQAWELECIR